MDSFIIYRGGKTAEKRRQQKNIDKAKKKIIWKTKREKKIGMLKGEKKKIQSFKKSVDEWKIVFCFCFKWSDY